MGIWRGQGVPQVGKRAEPRQLVCSDMMEGRERRLKRAGPTGPSRLPDLIRRAKDSNRDFKQDIMWRTDWRGQGLLLKLQHRCRGHSGSPLVLQELEHRLCSCKGTMSYFRRAGGTSGLPEMKSYSTGLSGPVCGKEQKGCLFTFHIRPQRPCRGGRFPRGKGTCGVLQDTQYPLPAFYGAHWPPSAVSSPRVRHY